MNDIISLIIVYTDEEKLDRALMYISKQDCMDKIQLILLDNRNKVYTNAMSAIKDGIEQAKGDTIVYMHQDMYLTDLSIISTYREFIREQPNSIVGVAGIRTGMSGTYTDIVETERKEQRGQRLFGKTAEAETLDECFFAASKSLFLRLNCDEKTCYNWHMYAVDFCYQNILMGNKNYILPAKVWHCHHANSQSKEFWRSLKNIVLKYQNTSIKDINTTCVEMKNSILVFYWLQLKQRIRVFIKNIAEINESNLK